MTISKPSPKIKTQFIDICFHILVVAHKPVWAKEVAVELNLSVRSAQRYLKDLAELGYLEKSKKRTTTYYKRTPKIQEMFIDRLLENQ